MSEQYNICCHHREQAQKRAEMPSKCQQANAVKRILYVCVVFRYYVLCASSLRSVRARIAEFFDFSFKSLSSRMQRGLALVAVRARPLCARCVYAIRAGS